MVKPSRGEYLHSKNATKQVYYFVDEKEGIDVKCREVFKKKPLEIHYPFDRSGKQKYKFVESIEFRDISPKIIDGIFKSSNFGLGFTKNLSPIIYRFEDDFPGIRKIIISPRLDSKIERAQATFNTVDLSEIFHRIKPLKEAQSEELKKGANNALAAVFPGKVEHNDEKYIKGNLGLYIKNKQISSDKLSKEDVGELIKLIPEHIAEESLLYQAEEKINFIKLSAIKKEFKKLVIQKTDTKYFEEKCQKFFTTNSWIFSNILSIPVALFKDKAYVGGKTIENKEGKIADFLYRNSLTQSVYIIEIKTPLKKLVDSKVPYRKPDVFSLGKELTGGLVQALQQKDKLQKNFYSMAAEAEEKFHSFNPRALLVIGRLADLKDKQLPTFELFRSTLKDAEIVTYDELLARTELVLGQFTDSKPKKAKKKKR